MVSILAHGRSHLIFFIRTSTFVGCECCQFYQLYEFSATWILGRVRYLFKAGDFVCVGSATEGLGVLQQFVKVSCLSRGEKLSVVNDRAGKPTQFLSHKKFRVLARGSIVVVVRHLPITWQDLCSLDCYWWKKNDGDSGKPQKKTKHEKPSLGT